MCAYYPSDRLLPYHTKDGVAVGTVDFSQLKKGFLSARIDVAEITRFSAIGAQNMLDKLLEAGHITPEAYVRRVPSGLICDRQALLEELTANKEESDDE